MRHGRQKVHDYFVILLCKSSIWFIEKNSFSKLSYIFLIDQNVPQIMSFHSRVYDGFIGQKILKL